MCDPVTLGIAVAASAGGAMINGQNAVDKANAANNVLAGKIGNLDKLGATNEATLGTDLNNYTPQAQADNLSNAQNARSNFTVSQISNPDQAGANDIPLNGSAPASVKSSIAKSMLSTYDGAVKRAQAMGKLGGYTDAWFNNTLGDQNAARNIGYTNDIAAGQKALINPEQQTAMYGTGNNPFGPILQGTGNFLGSYAGSGNSISSFLPSSSTFIDPAALA